MSETLEQRIRSKAAVSSDNLIECHSGDLVEILDALKTRVSACETALETSIMFLTNVNTITVEAQRDFVKQLRAAGMVSLADAVAVGGFAAGIFAEAE